MQNNLPEYVRQILRSRQEKKEARERQKSERENELYSIKVKHINNYQVQVLPDNQISTVKAELAELTGTHPEQLNLKCSGKELEDNITLKDYLITQDEQIFIIPPKASGADWSEATAYVYYQNNSHVFAVSCRKTTVKGFIAEVNNKIAEQNLEVAAFHYGDEKKELDIAQNQEENLYQLIRSREYYIIDENDKKIWPWPIHITVKEKNRGQDEVNSVVSKPTLGFYLLTGTMLGTAVGGLIGVVLGVVPDILGIATVSEQATCLSISIGASVIVSLAVAYALYCKDNAQTKPQISREI